jgi:hypothetical protein
MANALLEALSGSAGGSKDLGLGWETLIRIEKNRASEDLSSSFKIIFRREDDMTVCRPFIVRSRSRQPSLSICNLLRQVTTSCHTPCGGLSATPTREGGSQSSTAPELSIQNRPRRSAFLLAHPEATGVLHHPRELHAASSGGVRAGWGSLYGLSRRVLGAQRSGGPEFRIRPFVASTWLSRGWTGYALYLLPQITA